MPSHFWLSSVVVFPNNLTGSELLYPIHNTEPGGLASHAQDEARMEEAAGEVTRGDDSPLGSDPLC